MNIIAINGSPRRDWNTSILLQEALKGAASAGATTELIHLDDLDYHGCRSCFMCKRKDNPDFTSCAMQDGLTPALLRIRNADALLIGSPIYLGDVTGQTRSFLERLCFPFVPYGREPFPPHIPNAMIFTMNLPGAVLEQVGYNDLFAKISDLLGRLLGPSESLIVTETLQTDDYSKYHMAMFDEAERRQRRLTVFPEDCQRAFHLGVKLAQRP
jgi:multimeric flavodoxin WrbA